MLPLARASHLSAMWVASARSERTTPTWQWSEGLRRRFSTVFTEKIRFAVGGAIISVFAPADPWNPKRMFLKRSLYGCGSKPMVPFWGSLF